MVTVIRLTAARALWVAIQGARRAGGPSVGEHFKALPRMIHAGFTGRYPHLDKRRMGLALLGVVYVLSPFDLIPEIILPIIGLGDDAVVLAWLVGTVFSETDAFVRWEAEKARTIEGDLLP